MAKIFYEEEEVIWDVTFYSDRAKTTPVDPTTVKLYLQPQGGTAVELTVTEDGARPANVGKYTASHIFTQYGNYDWRWVTTTPRIVREGSIEVRRANTED